MDHSDILENVIGWISNASASKIGDAVLDKDTMLLERQLLDSLQIMDLVFHLESTFGNQIALDELTAENFETPFAVAEMTQRAIDKAKG